MAELHLIPGGTERLARTAAPASEDATLEFAPEPVDATRPARRPAPPPRAAAGRPPKAAAVPIAPVVRRLPLPVVAACGLAAGATVMWAVLADRPVDPPAIAPPPPAEGVLDVLSEPAGATVRVDDELRGLTPVSLTLSAGSYALAIQHEDHVQESLVEIGADTRTSRHVTWAEIPAPVPPPAPWGWISVSSPVPTRVLLNDAAIGTDALDRILLPPGTHELQFVSEAYGFRQTRTVEVRSGTPSPVRVSVPEAPISIDAQPWAEVYINGARVGDTPLTNVMRPLGDYEVVLRHPLFGERRLIARSRLGDPTRVDVDMRVRQD